ncbi:ABC transporter substrate-binding protein [Paenibacillus xanthanilyticus]|uniref:ABC transporter substrate-binding protein n=1 Tax=Paenibacillus xanthanilyticus TaxID=1783531 RepID=A0ABV8K0L9_9BACL
MNGFVRHLPRTGLAVCAAAILLAGCESGPSGGEAGNAVIAAPGSTEKGAAEEAYTLTFFTNNSDRAVGQGKMEQDLIDAYMRDHPNVTIEVETLSPDPQYQDKIKVYNASNKLPDIISSWGNMSFLKPLVESGALAEIDRSELDGHQFEAAALDSYSIDGKLYGFPRNSDFWVLYYNKRIFAENGLAPPATESELMDVVAVLKTKGIVPIAMDGREAWTSGIWFDTMLQRVTGTWDTAAQAMAGTGSFGGPETIEAAKAMRRWIEAGAFGDGFLNQDYGAARSLFGQGKAAMFMMGEWEMGMSADGSFPADVRDHIGAIPIPSVGGGRGTAKDLTAWFGGGYSVSAQSPRKAEAIAFLKWMFQPDNWAKRVWQNGITFPAQRYDGFMTGSESALQRELNEIYTGASSYSGTVSQDKFTSETQKTYYDALQKLEGGSISPEAFASAISSAAGKSVAESR